MLINHAKNYENAVETLKKQNYEYDNDGVWICKDEAYQPEDIGIAAITITPEQKYIIIYGYVGTWNY